MATLADLTAFRDSLRAARYQGAREVRDANGEMIAYKSDREMAAAMQALESEIAALSGTAANTIRFSTSKGL